MEMQLLAFSVLYVPTGPVVAAAILMRRLPGSANVSPGERIVGAIKAGKG